MSDVYVPFPDENFIVMKKNPDGSVETNVHHHWDKYIKSKNFNFNCTCIGTLNFALNILIQCGADKRAAFALHRSFADNFLREKLFDSKALRVDFIQSWIKHQTIALKLNLNEIEIF